MNGTEKLNYWQERYRKSKSAYQSELDAFDRYEKIYNGSRDVQKNVNASSSPKKKASVVRNICYELIEAQIDSNIPQPMVSALREEDVIRAQKCEDKLRCELKRLPILRLNDVSERFTYYLGGAFYHVEWDNTKRTRTTVGEVSLSVLHPRQFIPQQGVYIIDDMDYCFLRVARTREYIEQRYNVTLETESETEPEIRANEPAPSDDMVTQIICYYKNNGHISRYSWANDTVLEDIDDFNARKLRRCVKCGSISYDDKCTACGGKKFEFKTEEFETLDRDIVVGDEVIPAGTKIPYFKPDSYPIIARVNVSKFGSLLGYSDIDAINDQQEEIKKLQTKINEKLIKGGSFVTVGKGTKVKFDGEELKILRLSSPQEKNLIDVYTVQPNISQDMQYAESNYDHARQLLGITDSFQGRKDPTATSGRAKEFAAAQTQGRLESKRIMKASLYADIYKMLIQYIVAFADEERPLVRKDASGHDEFSYFSKYDFLKKDEAGQWYYCLDFLFSTDDSGSLAGSRQAMWQEIRMNFEGGAFGIPTEIASQILFWQFMEEQHYPNASKVKAILEKRQQEQDVMAQLAEENESLKAQLSEASGRLSAAEEINAANDMEAISDAEGLAGEFLSMNPESGADELA